MARRVGDAADPDQVGQQMDEFEECHGALVARLYLPLYQTVGFVGG